jgi:hypothetical protein
MKQVPNSRMDTSVGLDVGPFRQYQIFNPELAENYSGESL